MRWNDEGQDRLASKEKKNPGFIHYAKNLHFFLDNLVSLLLKWWFLRSSVFRVIAGAFFCRPDEFICNNTLCKLQTWVCDGKDDCGDNSDEDADMCGRAETVGHKDFPLKTCDKYFISPLFPFSSSWLFTIRSLFSDRRIHKFLHVSNCSKASVSSHKAVPLQEPPRLPARRSSLQQGGRLRGQLGRGRVR